MDITLVLDVHSSSEYAEMPAKAKVTLDPALVRRIRLFQKTVKALKATYIEEFDYTPEMQDEDGKESDVSVDCSMIKVSDTDFHWAGYLKHTDAEWSTDGVPIKLLCCPKAELPAMLGSDNEIEKAIAEQRLKGG